ncbi:MAG: TPM domain-containing protein, partial [Clostridia bacterium]|nr:TPM domain-containing protein [Clostridia bacterium]
MKKIFALALSLMLLSVSALAATSVLKPTDDFYVNDSANVLSDETEGHIILNNDTLYNACGAQIVFVTLDTTGTTKLENYAYNLFNEWKIGGSNGTGLLLVMAIEDDDYWLMPGKGLQDLVTAGDLGEMVDEYLEPYFARQDYDGGAKALFNVLFAATARALKASVSIDSNAYSRYIAQNTTQSTAQNTTAARTTANTANRGSDSEGSGFMGILLVVVVIIVIVLIVRSRKRRRVTYDNPNPTIIVNNPTTTNTARSYSRGFMAGMMTGSARRNAPPTPPPAVPPQTTRPVSRPVSA